MTLLLTATEAKADKVTIFFPDQEVAINQWGSSINKRIGNQNEYISKTMATNSLIAIEFNTIKNWEQAYTRYLKDAQGYLDMLRSGVTIYADGVEMLRNICLIQKAISINPQGVFTTAYMTDIYAETLAEVAKTYTQLKNVVAKGGTSNMLNTSERTELLWDTADDMRRLNKKLASMAFFIAYYNWVDVWRKATVGICNRPRYEIINGCFDGWKRRISTYHRLYYSS